MHTGGEGKKKKRHRGGVPGLVATRKGSGANLVLFFFPFENKKEMRELMNTR